MSSVITNMICNCLTSSCLHTTIHCHLDYCQYVHDAMSGKLLGAEHSRITPQAMAAEALDMMSLVRTLLERDRKYTYSYVIDGSVVGLLQV